MLAGASASWLLTSTSTQTGTVLLSTEFLYSQQNHSAYPGPYIISYLVRADKCLIGRTLSSTHSHLRFCLPYFHTEITLYAPNLSYGRSIHSRIQSILSRRAVCSHTTCTRTRHGQRAIAIHHTTPFRRHQSSPGMNTHMYSTSNSRHDCPLRCRIYPHC